MRFGKHCSERTPDVYFPLLIPQSFLKKEAEHVEGFSPELYAYLKDDPACGARLKEFKATVRCLPLADEHNGGGRCIVTGEPVSQRVVIAKAY